MGVDLKWYDPDDTTEASAIAFGTLAAGESGAAIEKHLWNGNGMASGGTASEVRVSVVVEDATGVYGQTERAAVEGWIEAKVVGSQGSGIEPLSTGWYPIGLHRWLALGQIPPDTARHVQFRARLPAGSLADGTTQTINARIVVEENRPAQPVSDGFHEAALHGVRTGLGDPRVSEVLSGLVATESGTPDDNVNLAKGTWLYNGEPVATLDTAVALDGNDANSVALASGESYWATLSAGATGITTTKSAKATSPIDVALRPPLPEGEALIAYVEREFDGTIEQANMYQDDMDYGRFGVQDSGLNVTVGPGEALVYGRLVRLDGPVDVVLAASLTRDLYLTPAGAIELVDSTIGPTDPLSEKLWTVTTDATSVTAVVDARRWLSAAARQIVLPIAGTLATNATAYAILAGPLRFLLEPDLPVAAQVDGAGTGTGSTVFDVEYRPPSGSWATIYTSQGTDDQRPTIASAATDPRDEDTAPEVLAIPAGSMIRAVVDAIPGTTASTDAVVLLRGEEVV